MTLPAEFSVENAGECSPRIKPGLQGGAGAGRWAVLVTIREYVWRFSQDPTEREESETMLRGFATINYWAADLSAARQWYLEARGDVSSGK